jgi:hypothetical protein
MRDELFLSPAFILCFLFAKTRGYKSSYVPRMCFFSYQFRYRIIGTNLLVRTVQLACGNTLSAWRRKLTLLFLAKETDL